MGMHQLFEVVQALKYPCACNALYALPDVGGSGGSKVQQIVSWTAKSHALDVQGICTQFAAGCKACALDLAKQGISKRNSQQLQTHSWQWR